MSFPAARNVLCDQIDILDDVSFEIPCAPACLPGRSRCHGAHPASQPSSRAIDRAARETDQRSLFHHRSQTTNFHQHDDAPTSPNPSISRGCASGAQLCFCRRSAAFRRSSHGLSTEKAQSGRLCQGQIHRCARSAGRLYADVIHQANPAVPGATRRAPEGGSGGCGCLLRE